MRALHLENRTGALAWLALAMLVSYANALGGPFQFDDYNVIVNAPSVHGWSNWLASVSHGIRPLLKLSYTLNWISGWGATGFHLTNLLIHFFNSYLVFCLVQIFIAQQPQHRELGRAPLLAALLFALHPIHTEAVTYISGRSASLMTSFYLAALLCYVTGRYRNNGLYLYAAAPLLFVLALAVKETAITFPLALLVWEVCCGDRWRSALKPLGSVWALSFVVVLFFLFNDSYSAQMQRSANLNSLQGNIATQLSGFAWLLKQWALPLWLNIDPDLPLLNKFSDALWPLCIFSALFVLMLACRRNRPWISFALAWMMLQLLPLYLFLPRLDVANEREWYLAGWPLLLALSIELTLRLNALSSRLVIAALLIVFTSLTVLRNQVYANEISLWQDTALKSPNKARVHNNLGFAYLQAHRTEDARHEFLIALELDPQLYQARYNLYQLADENEKAGAPLRPSIPKQE